MWISKPPKKDLPLPVWERGYHIHGYWLNGERMGHVGLAHHGLERVYSWALDADLSIAGETPTLKSAKRAVERAFRRAYSWRFPASRGY